MRFEVGDLCRLRSQYSRSIPGRASASGLIFKIDRELYKSWLNEKTGCRESQDRLHILWGDGTVGLEPQACIEHLSEGAEKNKE